MKQRVEAVQPSQQKVQQYSDSSRSSALTTSPGDGGGGGRVKMGLTFNFIFIDGACGCAAGDEAGGKIPHMRPAWSPAGDTRSPTCMHLLCIIRDACSNSL